MRLSVGTVPVSQTGFVDTTISDTGPGITKHAMENIWKPLQTTKAKGMGMGLAICKRLVDAHGGNIRVESETGQEATFTIKLPVKYIMKKSDDPPTLAHE
jgi:signal transduction histidine kinase